MELIGHPSYELPHRIHTAKVYPVKSSNGSTIIVYGHEHGLRILWRAGRSFKSAAIVPEKEKEKPKVNGASKDTIMIIDSDDEESASKPTDTSNNTPTFEDEENEYDPSEPYLPIVQHLDLPLGAEVFHISFPHLPSESSRLMSASVPPILSHKVIIAAACSDHSVRIITLPLVPPPPPSKAHPDLTDKLIVSGNRKGPHGEHILTLSGNTGHQTVSSGISITYTSRDSGKTDEEDMEMDEDEDNDYRSRSRSRRRSASRSRSRVERSDGGTEWDILLASHSPEVSGVLLTYRIPIRRTGSGSDTDHTLSTDHVVPSQTQYLPSPAATIAFNTSTYPSTRHSHLLVSCAAGAVRIYDCFPFTKAKHDHQGSWLLSLYPPWDNYPTGVPSRKRTVDTAWVLGGKAIMTLLADGEWGIWDVEGSGPGAKQGLRRRGNDTLSAMGGALATFALSGWLGSTKSSAVKGSSGKPDTKSKLAPMTPSTRRVREDILFSGPLTNGTYHLKGGISVTRLEEPHRDTTGTEAVTLWHGNKIFIIPNLLSYWEGQVGGKGNLFGPGDQQRSTKIDDLNLGGELPTTFDQLPITAKSPKSHRDMVIAAEHRLIFVTTPLQEATKNEAVLRKLDKPFSTDQQLLVRGELDVNGMERILAGMANGSRPAGNHRNGAIARKKVGFMNSR